MKSQITRQIPVTKSAEDIYTILSNLQQWNTWSPWAHCEPTCQTQVTGQPHQMGQNLLWDGEVMGAGKMSLIKLDPSKKIEISIEFFRPWKSISTAIFDITEQSPNLCTVTWTMISEMPFFMIFFKKMLEAYMGNDFERGLGMFKELSETGSVSSRSSYQGVKERAAFQMIGKKIKCKISEIAKSVSPEFDKMNQLVSAGQMSQPSAALSLTHDFNLIKGQCEITLGFYYPPDQKLMTPEGYEVLQIPAHKAIVIDHHGAYRHLRNPWAMAMSYQRQKKMKVSKKIPVYEIYKNNPVGLKEMDVWTEIIVPLK
jgi:predicted transcriptional regulator YdeE